MPQLPHLPQQLTSFIGREIELAELRHLLRERRLVTLTGAGGSGKTRLALETAATLGQDFPGGIFLVELASLSAPELVAEAVTRVLDIEATPQQPLMNLLTNFLQDRNSLLLLDNCEHLLGECARLVAGLLAACPDLHVLATSREPLGVLGECLFRVPLLSLPDRPQPAETPNPSDLVRFEAVQLFVDRARLASWGFALNDETCEAVAQVCIRLDGIPLALELAAASLQALSIEQLAAHLDRRFRLLTSGNRTALPRHQTLQALLDWSYTLLDARQQIVLRRLAIFPAEWAVEAAERVCAGEGAARDAGANNPPDTPGTGDPVPTEEILPILMQLVLQPQLVW